MKDQRPFVCPLHKSGQHRSLVFFRSKNHPVRVYAEDEDILEHNSESQHLCDQAQLLFPSI